MNDKAASSPASMTDCCASPGLLSVGDAVQKILAQAVPVVETESLPVEQALHRVLAEDLCSTIDVPGYDNSAMDGYAVASGQVEAGGVYPVSQRIPAGSTGEPLAAGSVARIFTGAPVPPGADAVVMQEQCETLSGENAHAVRILTAVEPGSHIRRAGEDIRRDHLILQAGKWLRPQELGLVASVGIPRVRVYRRLKVAMFFTGDELVLPGQALSAGQIFNSNQYTLGGLLQQFGCEVDNLGIVPDTLDDTVRVLEQAAADADLVLTSGGVSVGEEDYVRLALQRLGELSMWRVAMKPGKPVAFGRIGKTLFMGLPGNPVSVFVTGLLFARPLIRRCQGLDVEHCPSQALQTTVRAGFDWRGGSRQEYIRVRLEEQPDGAVATLYPHQGSGVLSSVSWADGLVEVPVGRDIHQGDNVPYLPFSGLL